MRSVSSHNHCRERFVQNRQMVPIRAAMLQNRARIREVAIAAKVMYTPKLLRCVAIAKADGAADLPHMHVCRGTIVHAAPTSLASAEDERER